MVELSQIPKQHQDMANKRFTLFNTNNVWISLKSLHQKLVEDRLTVDVVTHERVVDRVKILQVGRSVGRSVWAWVRGAWLTIKGIMPHNTIKTAGDDHLLGHPGLHQGGGLEGKGPKRRDS